MSAEPPGLVGMVAGRLQRVRAVGGGQAGSAAVDEPHSTGPVNESPVDLHDRIVDQ
jgi:hypothetical protein